jgi:Tol biopolymer transport system component
MTIAAGARLGPYEILAPIGSGGMGEVWKARDPRLGRDVAIKILPAAFSADADRLRRFEQEAQAAAALNHAHILAVYDVGTHDGQPYIVSELLEGETLRARLTAGPLPARKAVDYAVQIAHGLATAHDRGIVHRDLKPENVFVDSTSHIKILDFGLAKLVEREPAIAGMSALPTAAPDTTPGVVLGTIGYMSPEQVRGQTADHRADIFALGAVLYEMLSGARAFRRDTAIDTMTAILKEDPPDLPADDKRIPPALVRIVDRCLEKSASNRFQSAGDLAFALEALTSPSGEARSIVGERSLQRGGSRTAWTVAAILGVIAAGVGALAATMYFKPPAEVATLRYSVPPPSGWRLSLATRPGSPTPMVVAPDGRNVAFVVRRLDGVDTIWIQPLDALTPHPLSGTEGASSIFWSPDSRNLAFFANNKLKKVDIAGGPPTTICDAPGAAGGTWSRDGVIVFNGGVTTLKKVSASGGIPTDATTLGPGETAHFRPWLLPDGRHVLYTALGAPARPGTAAATALVLPIFVSSLDSTDRVRVGESSSTNVMYSQGHLLYMRDTTLMAQPFDPRRLATTGDPFPVVESIQGQGTEPHQGVFSVSQSGVLVYLTRTLAFTSQLTWMTRDGKPLSTVGEAVPYTEVTLSPDEKRAVVSLSTTDLWTIDLARGLRTRFTFDQKNHLSLLWSPDGQRIAFARTDGIFQKPSNGAGVESVLLNRGPNQAQAPTDWSPDGRYLLYTSMATGRGDSDVWLLNAGDRQAAPLLSMPTANETSARFSPDGRWVAYVSDESGRNEVYVVPFVAAGVLPASPSRGKWQISTEGGTLPRWRHDGKEIFYFDEGNSRLMAAAVNGSGVSFDAGRAQPLFLIRPAGGIGVFGPLQRAFYDVSHDGQRFLVNAESENSAPLPATVVVNWLAAVRK